MSAVGGSGSTWNFQHLPLQWSKNNHGWLVGMTFFGWRSGPLWGWQGCKGLKKWVLQLSFDAHFPVAAPGVWLAPQMAGVPKHIRRSLEGPNWAPNQRTSREPWKKHAWGICLLCGNVPIIEYRVSTWMIAWEVWQGWLGQWNSCVIQYNCIHTLAWPFASDSDYQW